MTVTPSQLLRFVCVTGVFCAGLAWIYEAPEPPTEGTILLSDVCSQDGGYCLGYFYEPAPDTGLRYLPPSLPSFFEFNVNADDAPATRVRVSLQDGGVTVWVSPHCKDLGGQEFWCPDPPRRLLYNPFAFSLDSGYILPEGDSP